MERSYKESRQSCVVNPRRKQGQHDGNEPDRMAQAAAGHGESHAEAARPPRGEEAGVCLHREMNASELETHLVRAITARTSGRVQGLRVRIRGERTVLSGFSESYYAIQLALAGLTETLDAMGLDHPGRVDLDIDVIQSRPTMP